MGIEGEAVLEKEDRAWRRGCVGEWRCEMKKGGRKEGVIEGLRVKEDVGEEGR